MLIKKVNHFLSSTMKITNLLSLAALSSAHVVAGGANGIDKRRLLRGGLEEDQSSRGLVHFEVKFEECLHKTFEECKQLIISTHAQNNALFGGEPTVDVIKKTKRTEDDVNYYMVGMRTNEAETAVVGVLGDGVIWYPFKWVLPAGTYGGMVYTEETPIDIGPWDCGTGMPLSPDQCCNLIKSSVPLPDVKGNYINCVVSAPAGSESNPIDPSRVVVVTDDNGIVIREPKTG